MPLKTLLAKTGVAGTAPAGESAVVGLNSNALPGADGNDAKGITLFQGMHLEEPFEVIFTKNAQDGTFYLEGSMDGSNFSRLSFRRLDTDVVIAGATGLPLAASTRLLIKLAQPMQNQRIVALRPGFFLAAADANAAASIVVRVLAGR